jgi:branched-subunit amino acid aminotransferase/4-amino-4-deoxychorismate lyase
MREARAAGADEPLLLGRGEEVLETAYGNVFITLDDEELWTPEEDARFLNGVARAVLLEALADRVMTRPIGLSELARAQGIWVTNAVFGPRRARLVDHDPAGAPMLDARLAKAWAKTVG